MAYSLAGWLDCLGVSARKKREGGMIAAPAAVPDDMILYAIGDIHGHSGLLRVLIDRIVDHAGVHARGRRPVLIYLGDYIDRGPDSRGTVDLVLDPPRGFAVHALLGNHEQAMLAFLDDPEAGQHWVRWSPSTLSSYGLPRAAAAVSDEAGRRDLRDALLAALPVAHLDFYRGLAAMTVYGGYAFVHAGVRPGVPLHAQTSDDLVWIREPFLDWPAPFEKVIVHGHSINDRPVIRRNRIGIDTGAYSTGVLTALALAGDEMEVLQVGA